MVSAERVTASDSAVALNTAGTGGQRLTITNLDDTNAVDLGGGDVAADAGFPLAAGGTFTVEMPPGAVLYAVRSTANDVELAVLRA